MGRPPVFVGALQVTVAVVLSGNTPSRVGAPGRPGAVTEDDNVDLALIPTAFTDATENTYVWPPLRPENQQEVGTSDPALAGVDVHVAPPG